MSAVDVPQPNWHNDRNENSFREVGQDGFILQSNQEPLSNAMSELMSSSLTDTKTAECLSVEIGQICCLLSNKIVVAHQVHQPYGL